MNRSPTGGSRLLDEPDHAGDRARIDQLDADLGSIINDRAGFDRSAFDTRLDAAVATPEYRTSAAYRERVQAWLRGRIHADGRPDTIVTGGSGFF